MVLLVAHQRCRNDLEFSFAYSVLPLCYSELMSVLRFDGQSYCLQTHSLEGGEETD